MEDSGLKYTLGFVFNLDRTRVLLVHKQKPPWQKGRVNGVGGKLEPGESPEQCISRETHEEVMLLIPTERWAFLGTIEQPMGNVAVFHAVYEGDLSDAARGAYEDVEWFDVSGLPTNVMTNLRWMIPLALENQKKGGVPTFTVRYG